MGVGRPVAWAGPGRAPARCSHAVTRLAAAAGSQRGAQAHPTTPTHAPRTPPPSPPSCLLAVVLVLGPGIPLPQGPVHAQLQRCLQVRRSCRDDALRPHAHGDVVKQGLGQGLSHGGDLGFHQVGAQQADAAVDVKPDTAGRDDGLGVARVKGGHVADGKAVARVQVRHGQRRLKGLGEGGSVGTGRRTRRPARPAGVHPPGHAHTTHPARSPRRCRAVLLRWPPA